MLITYNTCVYMCRLSTVDNYSWICMHLCRVQAQEDLRPYVCIMLIIMIMIIVIINNGNNTHSSTADTL